MTGAE